MRVNIHGESGEELAKRGPVSTSISIPGGVGRDTAYIDAAPLSPARKQVLLEKPLPGPQDCSPQGPRKGLQAFSPKNRCNPL